MDDFYKWSFVVDDVSQRIVAAKKPLQPLQVTITFREEEEKEAGVKKKILCEVTVEKSIWIPSIGIVFNYLFRF